MQETIRKINELYDLLSGKVKVADQLIEQNKVKEISLGNLSEALALRESKVEMHEEANIIKASAIKSRDEFENARAALNQERIAFENFKKTETAKIHRLADDARILTEKAVNERAAILKEWSELRKERAEMKEKVLEEIKKTLG